MGSNVEKINLDELRKAREALNNELGISTPEPKKNSKPESENVEIKTEVTSSKNNTEQKVENKNIISNNDESELDKDFSVYDNFSQFEINTENDVPSVEGKKDKIEEFASEQDMDMFISMLEDYLGDDLSDDLPIFDEDLDTDLDFDNIIKDIENGSSDIAETSLEKSDEIVDSTENEVFNEEPLKEQFEYDDIDKLIDEVLGNTEETVEDSFNNFTEESVINNTNSEFKTTNVNVENSVDSVKNDFNTSDNFVEYKNDKVKETFVSEKPLESENVYTNSENIQTQNNTIKSTAKSSFEFDDEPLKTYINTQKQTEVQNSAEPTKLVNPSQNIVQPQKIERPIKNVVQPKVENSTQSFVEPKIIERPVQVRVSNESNTTPKYSEAKVKFDVDMGSTLYKSEETFDPSKYLQKIEDKKFIDIIRSQSFMGTDNFTCIYGIQENGDVFCQNFKDFYNTIVFSEKDENVFNLFSSIIMSLLLKNSKYDINFAICDAKNGGPFSIYNNLSYMFFDKVAESNRDIIHSLKLLSKEIDKRYEALAKANVKSIEKFNDEMKKAHIAPLPYIILFFNNYTRAAHLDDSNEIDTSLSYILRFGRLVGINVFLVSFDENIADRVNFNLQTRMAFKTELVESSIAQIGESGAEKVGYEDEYVVKTLYSDKLIHLKPTIISQKEIELLIKNIEK